MRICFKVILAMALVCGGFTGLCPAGEKQEILVGTHLPLTGMMATVGQEQKWAYEAAVRDVNNRGGVFVSKYNKYLPVRLLVVDDQTNPALAAAAVESLITRSKVDVILSGHTAAFGVIPGCVVAEKYQVYYHATGCYGDLWLEHKFKYSTLLFYDLRRGAEIPFLLWETMPQNAKPQKIAMLAEDTFDARIMMDTLREKALEKGYNIVMEKYWVPQTGNYHALITALENSGADSVFLMGTTADCIKVVGGISKAKISLKYIHCWRGAWSSGFWDALRDDAQYVFADGHWCDDYPFEGAKELGKRYQAEFADKSVSVGAFYAAAQILFKAIEEAGSLDAQKIRNSVVLGSFDTVMGPLKYNGAGVAYYESIAFQWLNDKLWLVWPLNLATHKPVFAQTEPYEKKE